MDLGEAQQFEITRSKPHGHVAAVLGTLRKVGLERIIHSRQRRERDLVVAMIVARIVEPGSKLATARGLSKQTLTSSLGECVGVEDTNEDELYDSLDWLLSRQAAIEKKLAKRHLQQGSLVLYDLTSTWVEGRSCPLAKLGYSRDGKKNKLQVVFGLLCERDGRPVGVEVFEGNTGDPATLGSQIRKVRERCDASDVEKFFRAFESAHHFILEIVEGATEGGGAKMTGRRGAPLDDGFDFERDNENIEREAALDSIYIIRTSLTEEAISADEAVRTYKGLAVVERAFRCCKTVDLKVRPIYHYNAERVRAHIFLCMLAYYVEWHMRKALVPILFDDDDPDGAHAKRSSIVSPATPSDSAQAKASTKKTPDGLPVHSFRTLLSDLATVTKNQVENEARGLSFVSITRPTPLQHKAFNLLEINPRTM